MIITLEDVLELVEVQLGKRKVNPSDHFINDLNAESLDMVNLAGALEDRFGVIIPEEVLVNLQTVQDLYEYLATQTTN